MFSECRIRQARRSDLRDIYLIEVKSFPYPYPIEAFISLMVLFPKYFFVAVCGGRIAGYVTGALNDDGTGHIMSLAVHPQYRGKGIGSMLLKAIENAYRADGVRRVYLEVAPSNKEALSLYKKFNYKMYEMKVRYYPDGSDAYVMVKEL